MRIWNRLKGWVEEEAESASQYQRLVQNTALHAKGAAGLMTDPELSPMLDWQQKRRPNAAWGERYQPGFTRLSRSSKKAAKRAMRQSSAEQERQRRELRRTRQIAAVLGTAFLLAVGFGGYALFEQRRATAEQLARQQSDGSADAEAKTAEEQEQARQQSELSIRNLLLPWTMRRKRKQKPKPPMPAPSTKETLRHHGAQISRCQHRGASGAKTGSDRKSRTACNRTRTSTKTQRLSPGIRKSWMPQPPRPKR